VNSHQQHSTGELSGHEGGKNLFWAWEGGVALELNKLTGQVAAMGGALARRRQDLLRRGRQAQEALRRAPEVTEELKRKIAKAREIDAWRRGALPLGERLDERRQVNSSADRAILIAADGSQIYPDRHGIAAYYLLNTGSIVLRRGSGAAPAVNSVPEIYFEDDDLYDEGGQTRTAEYVNTRRNRRELATLADLAEAERAAAGGDLATPIVALLDGPLLPWMRPEAGSTEAIDEEIRFFVRQLQRLRDTRCIPVGYVDRPGSAYVLRILELVDLSIEEITRETLRHGRFRMVTDRVLFADLAPNERTGLFTPNSDTNDRYERVSSGDRVVFAYANLSHGPEPGAGLGDAGMGAASSGDASIARVEVPGWVAADPDLLDIAQAAIYADCALTGFPYVLARAHELAVVNPAERDEFEAMLGQAMLRHDLHPETSHKAQLKRLTGSKPRRAK